MFRRELIKDWPHGLAWGKTLCNLWKFPACKWAGKKWREQWFACFALHLHMQHQTSIRIVSNSSAKLTCSGFLGFLVCLAENSPGIRDIDLGLFPYNWVPRSVGDRITCLCPLANSAAEQRAVPCHRAQGFPHVFASGLVIKRVFWEWEGP